MWNWLFGNSEIIKSAKTDEETCEELLKARAAMAPFRMEPDLSSGLNTESESDSFRPRMGPNIWDNMSGDSQRSKFGLF